MFSDYHSTYYRVESWKNAKASRVIFQWVPLASNATHTFMTPPFLDFWRFGVFFQVLDGVITR